MKAYKASRASINRGHTTGPPIDIPTCRTPRRRASIVPARGSGTRKGARRDEGAAGGTGGPCVVGCACRWGRSVVCLPVVCARVCSCAWQRRLTDRGHRPLPLQSSHDPCPIGGALAVAGQRTACGCHPFKPTPVHCPRIPTRWPKSRGRPRHRFSGGRDLDSFIRSTRHRRRRACIWSTRKQAFVVARRRLTQGTLCTCCAFTQTSGWNGRLNTHPAPCFDEG